MPRIKIKDLPKDTKISKDEMKKIIGGSDILLKQQMTQLYSNILKMWDDTEKAIINNLR